MYILNKLIRKLVPQTLSQPDAQQRRAIDALRADIAAIEERVSSHGGEATDFWLSKRRELRSSLLHGDPRGFVDLPVIRETIFVDAPTYLKAEFDALRAAREWATRWRPSLSESRAILAPACPYYPRATGSAIHYAYHVERFERSTGLKVPDLRSIVEFGGGFGGMARVVRTLGFAGRYAIFDFPEFAALQRFYLSLNGIAPESLDFNSDVAALRAACSAAQPDLFIATWSLSEVPFGLRDEVLGFVEPRAWLIAFQHEFQGLDNLAYFEEWIRRNPRWKWRLERIEHHPQPQFYLFGA